MTPDDIRKFYAVPVLANVPVVTEFGEGDFSYNGLRGLGGAMDAPTTSSIFTNLDGSPKFRNIGIAAAVGYVIWKTFLK